MATAEQNECETYRVIMLGRSGTEVLLVPDGDRFALPSVEIPRWLLEEPTISPDGRWLLYSRSNGGSSLWLLKITTGQA